MGLVSRPSGVAQDDSGAQPKPAPVASASSPKSDATASGIPQSDKYVDKLLRGAERLPPVTWANWHERIRWFNLSVIVITPLLALYGAATTYLEARTVWFGVVYYVFNMIGGFLLVCSEIISNFVGTLRNHGWYLPCLLAWSSYHDVSLSGYHRLWSHRAYNASKPLEYFLAVAGGGSVQGAIWWWARGHRSHHR